MADHEDNNSVDEIEDLEKATDVEEVEGGEAAQVEEAEGGEAAQVEEVEGGEAAQVEEVDKGEEEEEEGSDADEEEEEEGSDADEEEEEDFEGDQVNIDGNGWCNICGAEIGGMLSILHHQRIIHKNARRKCPTCGRRYMNMADLQIHREGNYH